MEIKVNFLDKLRLEAKFDDFTVVADQPIRYKGDGSAPGPFDYFLASSALCAAYFVKLYCNTRDIPTDNIRLSQNNIVDPENRYKQIFKIQVELPEDISDKDRQGILRSIERCTVKKVVQTGPEFVIEEVDNLDADAQALLALQAEHGTLQQHCAAVEQLQQAEKVQREALERSLAQQHSQAQAVQAQLQQQLQAQAQQLHTLTQQQAEQQERWHALELELARAQAAREAQQQALAAVLARGEPPAASS